MGMFESYRAAVLAEPWGNWTGAYGPSDGADNDLADVPTTLLGLVEAAHDPDRRQEHLDSLYAHLAHQGEIYEATAHVVPFLVQLIEDVEIPDPGPIGVFIAYSVACATRAKRSPDPSYAAFGHAVLAVIDDLAPKIAGWVSKPELDLPLARIAVDSAAVRPAWLAAVTTTSRLAAHEYVALAAMPDEPSFVRFRAEDAMTSAPGTTQLAAAYYLRQRCADSEPELAERIDAVLGLRAQAQLREELGWLFDLEIDRRPTSDRPKPLDEAQVIFRGHDLFLAKRHDSNVTVRWPDAPVEKGDQVRLATTPDGIVRVVEIERDGATIRQEFDLGGEPVPTGSRFPGATFAHA